MEDIVKYLGLPYGFTQGRYNCIDLCRLFYMDHGYSQDFENGTEMPCSMEDFNNNHRLRLLKYIMKNFDRDSDINNVRYGDLILFEVLGDIHTGIYIGDGNVLAMQVPCQEGKSLSCVYKKKFWSIAFKYCFHPKEK